MKTCLLCSNISLRYPQPLPLPPPLFSLVSFALCNAVLSGQEALCEEESGAVDPKDPNRPRFTLQELRDVLHERNELKAKVFLLQEELAYYKRYVVLMSHLSSTSSGGRPLGAHYVRGLFPESHQTGPTSCFKLPMH